MTNREHRRAAKPLGLTPDERSVLAASEANPDWSARIVSTFGNRDTDYVVAAIELAIEGALARDTQSLAPLLLLPAYTYTLPRAPIPLRVDYRALRRCCQVAWGGDEDAQLFQSTAN